MSAFPRRPCPAASHLGVVARQPPGAVEDRHRAVLILVGPGPWPARSGTGCGRGGICSLLPWQETLLLLPIVRRPPTAGFRSRRSRCGPVLRPFFTSPAKAGGSVTVAQPYPGTSAVRGGGYTGRPRPSHGRPSRSVIRARNPSGNPCRSSAPMSLPSRGPTTPPSCRGCPAWDR